MVQSLSPNTHNSSPGWPHSNITHFTFLNIHQQFQRKHKSLKNKIYFFGKRTQCFISHPESKEILSPGGDSSASLETSPCIFIVAGTSGLMTVSLKQQIP